MNNPYKLQKGNPCIQEALIRSGTAILTEQGFATTGIDGILKQVSVPKGSFYYYFANKKAFGLAILDYYALTQFFLYPCFTIYKLNN